MTTSESVDDYLKAILDLTGSAPRVTTSALARRLSVTPASVTGMVRRLAGERPALVRHEKHRGVALTEEGRLRALEILRHHRLIESYLHDRLGYAWDEVHAEAEKLEHAISETLEDRMAEALGDPEVDPHGHPIPRKDGTLLERAEICLVDLDAGVSARVTRVSDEDPELLRYLAELGLRPGIQVKLLARGRFDGPLTLEMSAGTEKSVSRQVAASVHVSLGGR